MVQSNDTSSQTNGSSSLVRAKHLLESTPLIDGHNDFPYLLRQQLRHKIYDHDLSGNLGSHTSIPKMRKGMMGGQFWSIFVLNPEEGKLVAPDEEGNDESNGTNGDATSNGQVQCCNCELIPSKGQRRQKSLGLNEPNHCVRDTLEQIDITHRFVNAYPDTFTLCTNPSAVRTAFASGKIASMLGVEGGHSTGNSIATLRLFFDLGVRYMTLTHNSDNAFGTSWITVAPHVPDVKDTGLTNFGEACVLEMNRLGMLVDLSHVSHQTMRDALRVTKAPVIFSHSASYAMTKVGRNVPDDVLHMVKANGGVVMVPSVPYFLRNPEPGQDFTDATATVEDYLDHVVHIAELIGWEHVGVGSDFDGCPVTAQGLEDTSKWPDMIARLLEREQDLTDDQVKGLIGENLLRVWEQAERVADEMQKAGARPTEEHWEGRIWEPEDTILPRIFSGGKK